MVEGLSSSLITPSKNLRMLWLQVAEAYYMQADQATADNELERDSFWLKAGYVPCSPSSAVAACKVSECSPAVRPCRRQLAA